MTPAQLPNNLVSPIFEGLADFHRVIPALAVVFVVLLIGGVRVIVLG
jgi:hypothetical protein